MNMENIAIMIITTMTMITNITTMTTTTTTTTTTTITMITNITTMIITTMIITTTVMKAITHADEVFTSWGVQTPHRYTKDEMESILRELSESENYGTVLRAKGMVYGEGNSWIYFDLVPGEYEIRDGAPEYTGQICVIGSKIREEALKELFHV